MNMSRCETMTTTTYRHDNGHTVSLQFVTIHKPSHLGLPVHWLMHINGHTEMSGYSPTIKEAHSEAMASVSAYYDDLINIL